MADNLAANLAKFNVKDDRIVSFEGQGLKLDNAQLAEDIVRAIETCASMEILNLAGNTLGVEAAQEIANALQSRPTFKFALWKDMFTGRLRSEIPAVLRSLSSAMIIANTQLVELDLSDNAFGPDGAEAIRGLLTSPVAYTIQTLKFQNNGLGGGGVIIADCLTANHARAKKAGKSLDLRTFIAGRNRLENPGAKALGAAFSLLGTLEQIEVIQNGIQYEGIAALADCIKHSPNLKILNLNDNIMTPRGAIAIAEALPSAKMLEVLNIGDCLVKSKGALAVAENIKGLTKLKELILSYNEIQSDGGEAIAKACSKLGALTTLDLDGNHFGDDGKTKVSDALGVAKLSLLKPGLDNDEGIPSDDEGEAEEEEKQEEKEEKQDSPEKAKAAPAPFVFGAPAPKLVGSDDPNKTFGFGVPAGADFSFGNVGGTNIFAKKDEGDHSFKGVGTALFSAPGTDGNPEGEPDVHFEALVHLEKVEVKTGDEDDEELYKHRAKLFRFDKDVGAWKERGVGDIRVLQNKFTKKSRLLMRRDIILKICCNHLITKQTEMKPNAGSNKSLVWFTSSDYSEGEPKPEQLAVRFKTPAICAEFLEAFTKAKEESPEPGSTPIKKPEPAAAPKPAAPKPTEPATPAPFSFASLAANAEKAAFAAKTSPQKTPVKVADGDAYREEAYEPDVQFDPIVKLDKVETNTGTENEEIKFTHRCKLYRFDKDVGAWKERGLGDISVLWNKKEGKGRVLMRREQILKLCCNHNITPEMEMKPHQGNDKFWVWHTFADFTEGEPRFEQLAARFKTAEVAAQFKAAFEDCQNNLGKVDLSEDPEAKQAEEAIEKVNLSEPAAAPAKAGGMAAFLSKQKDNWTCNTCDLSNEKSANKCIACQTANPDAPPEAADNNTTDSGTGSKFTFGMSNSAVGGFTFGTPAATAPAATGGSGFSFGPPTSGFSFGNTAAAVPAPVAAAPAFSFGTPAPAATPEVPSSGFSFGTTAPAAAAPTFQFGSGAAPTPPPVEKTPAKEEEKPSLFAGFSFGTVPKADSPALEAVQTVGASSAVVEITVDYPEFVAEPSEAILEKITKPESVAEAVGCSDPANVASFVGKLSRVMSNKTTNTSHQIVDSLLSSCFAQNSPSMLTNELLVTMGLIKSEKKNFKPESDVENMLRLMAHAVGQEYFPQSSAKIISAFVKKDKEVLTNKISDCADLFKSFQI